MQRFQSGSDFIIVPEVHKRTLIWIHGYGDTGELFCDDFFAAPLLPDCKVVLPTAPLKPVGGELKTTWYDRKGVYEYNESMDISAERIIGIIREESKYTDDIIIGGFSQGAVMSLYIGLSKYEGPIRAIVALSGFAVSMPFRPDFSTIPVLWYHGGEDKIIPITVAENSIRSNMQGVNLTLQIHPTMPHEVYLEEYEFIRSWLNINLRL